MDSPETYLHTWELSPRSRLLRFYCWLYRADINTKLSFCKLFWAILLSPFTMIGWIFVFIGRGIAWTAKTVWRVFRRSDKPERDPNKKSWTQKMNSEKVSKRIWLFILLPIYGLLGLYWLGRLGYLCYLHPSQFLSVMQDIMTGLGCLTVLWGLSYLLVKIGFVAAASGWVYDKTLAPLGRMFAGVGRFLASGYYATKYRTCPKVVVKQ